MKLICACTSVQNINFGPQSNHYLLCFVLQLCTVFQATATKLIQKAVRLGFKLAALRIQLNVFTVTNFESMIMKKLK